MTRERRPVGALLLAGAIAAGLAAAPGAPRAAEPLAVCLEEDSPPFSYKFGKRRGGFDLAVAGAVADAMGRPLAVQWFESENDDENVPAWEANALLANGFCDLLGGYPLFAAALREPPAPGIGRLPDYEGRKPADRWKTVRLGVVAPTRPYRRTAFAIVLGPDSGIGTVRRLRDLAGKRIAAEAATLAGALLVRHDGGSLMDDMVQVAPGDAALEGLEAGAFDAALIELHRYDWRRRRNPDGGLAWSGYAHPVGVNHGFLALAGNEALIAETGRVLEDMLASGALEALARANGLTWIAPAPPDVLRAVTPEMLRAG